MDKVAIIDIGTNSVLYLLAGWDGELVRLDEGIRTTRLGRNLGSGGSFDSAGISETVNAVCEFAEMAQDADEMILLGTAALRDVELRRAFERELATQCSHKLKVLSPEEEGELALLAARRTMDVQREPLMVIDVGGGSAQIIHETQNDEVAVESFPIGCVYLTERFAKDGKPNPGKLLDYLRGILSDVHTNGGKVVITGGTATTAAAIINNIEEHSEQNLHQQQVSIFELTDLARRVKPMSVRQKIELTGMPEKRAEVFETGLLTLIYILIRLHIRETVVSFCGIRFGAAYEHFGTN